MTFDGYVDNSAVKARMFADIIGHRPHKKHNSVITPVRKEGSPGFDKEAEFNTLLSWNRYIKSYNWLSEHEKTIFDFEVVCDGGHLLIDVVSYEVNNGRLQLNTAHKNIQRLMEYAKNHGVKACYLAFPNDEIDMGNIRSWRFLRITEKLPFGNIYISKSRSHGLLTADYLFRDKRSRKTIMRERLMHKYAPREERWKELEAWIYGTNPTDSE